jgi:hypothetical protein
MRRPVEGLESSLLRRTPLHYNPTSSLRMRRSGPRSWHPPRVRLPCLLPAPPPCRAVPPHRRARGADGRRGAAAGEAAQGRGGLRGRPARTVRRPAGGRPAVGQTRQHPRCLCPANPRACGSGEGSARRRAAAPSCPSQGPRACRLQRFDPATAATWHALCTNVRRRRRGCWPLACSPTPAVPAGR